MRIARELITKKLAGQEQVARYKLLDSATGDTIAQFRTQLATAEALATVRLLESQGAAAYWSAWRTLPINFPRNQLARVPDHWRMFGARISPLTRSPRLAVNPLNAILNYLYALLESEARLAAAALGLDPGLGVLHADAPNRDSLAFDLMEPVRPQIDAFLLDWITREPLDRNWFFEQRDGNCRLMGSFATTLAKTAPTWARAVAPFAEWLARTLWSRSTRHSSNNPPATRLTQLNKREAKGSTVLPVNPSPHPPTLCRVCGVPIDRKKSCCAVCAVSVSKEKIVEYAKSGRIASHSPEAQARRKATKRRHDLARRGWLPSSLPAWLTSEFYDQRIQPRLAEITVPAIASAIYVSLPYATDIRAGRRRPHPRHWQPLAKLVGVGEAVSK